MILSLHSIAGAVLASNSRNIWEAIIIGLTSHYFFDSIPHIEYKIENIKTGNFKIAIKDYVKVFIDLLIGLLVILYLIKNVATPQILIILAGGFFAIIPDGFAFLNFFVKNKHRNLITKFLSKHSEIHTKIHSATTNKFIATASQFIIAAILLFAILK